MKLKTSCYEPAFGRMNLRRFGPVWILYTIVLLLLAGTLFSYNDYTEAPLRNLLAFGKVTALVNLVYTVVLVQLLFGDLYTPRLCYALHSMPVTRGGWFGTQIILCLLGSCIPNLICAGVLSAYVTQFRITLLWWLAAAELQFLFCFGIAVLSAICAGNRIGMLSICTMLNLAGLCICWFYIKLFVPLIYAMYIPSIRYFGSPALSILDSRLFTFDMIPNPAFVQGDPTIEPYLVGSVSLTSHMWELAVYGLIGCGAIALAMWLFRKRKPECAGDLLAFPKTKPIFLVLFTLGAGFFAHVAAYVFNWGLAYPFLALGLVIGYYVCLMLLKRQINVFTLRSAVPLAAICGVLLIALTLTGLDLFGVTYRVPKVEEVESVTFHPQYSGRDGIQTSDPEEIAQIIAIQEDALERHRQEESRRPLLKRIFGNEDTLPQFIDFSDYDHLFLSYKLKNGSTINRCYLFTNTDPSVPALRQLFSRPEIVFSAGEMTLFTDEASAHAFLGSIQAVNVFCSHDADNLMYGTYRSKIAGDDYESLLHAMLEDAREGTLAQEYFLHVDETGSVWSDHIAVYFDNPEREGAVRSLVIYVFRDSTHTNAWLADHGCHDLTNADPE